MGFTAAEAQAMSAPPYFIALLSIAACGLLTDKYRQRSLAIIIPGFAGFVGMLICMTTADKRNLVPLTCESYLVYVFFDPTKLGRRPAGGGLLARSDSRHRMCHHRLRFIRYQPNFDLFRRAPERWSDETCRSTLHSRDLHTIWRSTRFKHLSRTRGSQVANVNSPKRLLIFSNIQDRIWYLPRCGLYRLLYRSCCLLHLDRPYQQEAGADVR